MTKEKLKKNYEEFFLILGIKLSKKALKLNEHLIDRDIDSSLFALGVMILETLKDCKKDSKIYNRLNDLLKTIDNNGSR